MQMQKLKKIKNIMLNTYYSHCYYKKQLKENLILIESKNGDDLAGNMFQILKELTTDEYKDYKVCLCCLKDREKVLKARVVQYGIKNVTYIHLKTYKYFKYLATAKYLFTDTTYLRSYIKKEGQIVTNTWHGTPLKKMGRDVEERAFAMGNVQRNLLFADYLIFPNDYMKEKMVSAYMLQDMYEGTILNEGYPRNSVFFDKNAGQYIRKELGLENKQVYMYMPTWRGNVVGQKTNLLLMMLEYYLLPIDRQLKDDQVIYVKLHPFVRKDMDFSKYKHIKDFPNNYDAYEFMNMCDGLITDYSSVFYDFANTRKKIIIFAYDETEYLGDRGVYVPLTDMPFPVVKSADALVREINTPKNYDDTEFVKQCCTYDNIDAVKKICRHVIKGEKVCAEEKLEKDGKKKVMMYGSALAKNGLTTSLLNLFSNIDLQKRHYYVSFMESTLRRNPTRVGQIPPEVGVMPISSEANFTFLEAVAYVLYFKKDIQNKFIDKMLDRLYQREMTKHFGAVRFDFFIQFAGYEKKLINLFQRFHGPRFIYVHNDMVAEIKTRANQHYLTLKSAYQNYDKVAVVTKDIFPPTFEISKKKDNIMIVNNCHAHNDVKERSELELQFDPETVCNVDIKELKQILDSDKKKFISIGRFSPEKGHMMLIKAFEQFSKKNPDNYLIIIGGHGELYGKTLDYVSMSRVNIILIRSMRNPMPVLKKCDLFILSSIYEGLGLTMLEADALGIPSMSTNIPGPQGFMQEHGGYLVDPSKKGLLEGMNAFMKGKVKAMNVNYDEYNQHAVQQFEALFEEYEK